MEKKVFLTFLERKVKKTSKSTKSSWKLYLTTSRIGGDDVRLGKRGGMEFTT